MVADDGTTPERNTGFDEKTFSVLMHYEDWHWWFQRRNKLIVSLVRRFGGSPERILEIGCGNGLVTGALHDALPEAEIVGTEYFEEGLANARARFPSLTFRQLDARDLDDSERYDAICAFDVLEHIDADVAVLEKLRAALRDDKSRLFITVPQHMALWSEADVYARHERRYTFKELKAKLAKASFDVEFRSSYVFLLSPLMLVSRYLKKKPENYDVEAEFRISRRTNRLLNGVMAVEERLRYLGMPMPFGGSLVVVAKPIEQAQAIRPD